MGEVVEREPGALHSSGETNNTLLVALSSFPHKFKVLLARTCERVCSFVAKFVFCLTGTVPNEAGDHRAGRLANMLAKPRHMGPESPPRARPCPYAT
jgi:hypothetical protein